MSQKQIILFISSFPDIPIGYSKVSNQIMNYFAELQNTEVYNFGFSNIPGVTKLKRYINPKIKFIDVYKEEKILYGNDSDLYGVNIFIDTINRIKPNILFFYNDVIVISRLLNKINDNANNAYNDYKIYTYVDLVYEYERPTFVNYIIKMSDKIFVFSEYWKEQIEKYINSTILQLKNENLELVNNLELINSKLLTINNNSEIIHKLTKKMNNIEIIYHGVDDDIYDIMDTNECKNFFKFKENDFIILNANRNTYRKALDITIAGFLLFLKKCKFQNKFKLYLKCEKDNRTGYNILSTIESYCLKLDLMDKYKDIIINNIFILDNSVEDSVINMLYNACDVGINTCIGEGFGLCNLEHGILGKPQLVTNIGGLSDIFKDMPCSLLNPKTTIQVSNICDEHNGIGHICSYEEVGDKLYDIYINYNKYKEEYKKFRNMALEKYNWDNILKSIRL